MKLTGKMKPSLTRVFSAEQMQVGIRIATAKVRKLKKDQVAKGFGKGLK